MRRKSLLIGINYTGSQHALAGCHQDVANVQRFLAYKGYPTDPASQVILTDARQGIFYPTGHNMLAAMQWLISEPNCTLFFHYSGHGGQVRDPDGDRMSGFDDTIVPVDFESKGQIDSDTLHRHLISRMPPSCTMFVLFDCCHSGSALELPYVYRTDEYGNVNMVDTLKQGMTLVGEANHLIQGGFSMTKVNEAKHLLAGAQSLWKSFQHMGQAQRQDEDEDGLAAGDFAEDWASEHKQVFMFSGCRDDQTSADAAIGGNHVGAMSWAFLQTVERDPGLTFLQILQNTRALLKGRYEQVPQLSMGIQIDLNNPLYL